MRSPGEVPPRREPLATTGPAAALVFRGLTHVRDIGLQRGDDKMIWEWVKVNGYTVITIDSDFVAMSQRLCWSPKVIHIEHCDYPFRVIEDILRRNAVRISGVDKDNAGLLTLRLPTD